MIRRPPRSTLDRSSAASYVSKRQAWYSSGECARKLGIAALIMAVLIIAGLILQRKREYYEYKKEDE